MKPAIYNSPPTHMVGENDEYIMMQVAGNLPRQLRNKGGRIRLTIRILPPFL